MHVFESPDQARAYVSDRRRDGDTIGLVPTMGALHAGHLSLVKRSRETCQRTVATIFVNPTQFAPHEDFERYPRPHEHDLELLREAGADGVYLPEPKTIYPEGFSTFVEPPEVARTLEGHCRPGHFRGVATVVLKLFHAIPATHAFFGRKDYQQWKVIEVMSRDLDLGIEIVAGETVREADGLALSSRNRYLSEEERRRAVLLSHALQHAATSVQAGNRNVSALETEMRRILVDSPAGSVDKIDYAAIVDAESLVPVVEVDRAAVALIAAFVGKTRLIDNRLLQPAAV